MPPAIHVIATTMEGTRAALAAAVPLANASGARLVVLVPRIVSYSVDLDARADATAFFVRRYQNLVDALGGRADVHVCVCRSIESVIDVVALDGSRVVVGGPVGRWLTSPEERFANRLIRRGCDVWYVASGVNTTQRRISPLAVAAVAALTWLASVQGAGAQTAVDQWQYGGFVDVGAMLDTNTPDNHLFRNRGTTPYVDELALDMAAAYVRKTVSESSRAGFEATVQAGKDSEAFGFSAVEPNISGADALRHFGPLNASYLAPVGAGVTIQGGIFSSLIGYDSLYARDNLTYTRPWGADYTPYLMMGVNAAYPVSANTTLTGFLVNSYFHLARADSPSAGGQVAVKVAEGVSVKETAMYGSGRFLSDSIVERKTAPATIAGEYQLGAESDALWMAAQLPIVWRLRNRWAISARPEVAWDRDGRWIGVPESVMAFTTTVEYRSALGGGQAILRGEYRIDSSHGVGQGFYAGADNHLTATQHLFVLAAIVTFDGEVHR